MPKFHLNPLAKGLSIALSSLLFTPAFADDATEAELAPVDVVEKSDAEVTATSSSLNYAAIQKSQATQLSDVLNRMPAVDAGGSAAINSVITLRGASEDLINVSVDGARQEGYMFHHSGNYNIDPSLLKRVDVNAGSNTIRDVDSQAGSIRFETVDASDLLADGEKAGGFVKYQYSTNVKSNDVGLAAFGRLGEQFDLLFYGHYIKGKAGKSGDGLPMGNATEQKNGLVKAKWHISDGHAVGVSHEHYYNNAQALLRANFGYQEGFNDTTRKYETERDTTTLRYQLNPSENPYLNMDVRAYQTLTSLKPMQTATSNTKKTKIETKGVTFENESVIDLGSQVHTISIGGEQRKTTSKKPINANPKNNVAAYTAKEELKHSYLYIEDAIALSEGRLVLTPAIRYDHYDAHYNGLDKTFSQVSGAFSINYQVSEDFGVFAAVTDIFQAPALQESQTQPRRSYDPNIKGVKGRNYQIGFNYDTALTDNAHFNFSVTPFITKFSRFIDVVGSNYTDIGKAENKGIEAKIGYQSDTFSTTFTYAKSKSEVKATGLSAYRHSGTGDTFNLNLDYQLPETDISLNWNSHFVKGLNTKSSSRGKVVAFKKAGYGVHDFTINYQPQSGQLKGLNVSAGVYNVFDKVYVDHASYLGSTGSDKGLGRSVRVGLKYDF